MPRGAVSWVACMLIVSLASWTVCFVHAWQFGGLLLDLLVVCVLCVVWPDSLPVLELIVHVGCSLLITMRVLRCPPKVYPRYDVLAAAMHMCLTALIVHSVHDNWTD